MHLYTWIYFSAQQTWGQFNSGIGIDYLKKMNLNWNWKKLNLNWEILNWNWSFLQKNLIQTLIYHFYNVNTYMWCYQYTGTIIIRTFGSLYMALLFGENPQAVAYSAQPLCWSGWEIASSPTTHRGAVRKDGAEIPWGWSLPECFTSSGVFNVTLYF